MQLYNGEVSADVEIHMVAMEKWMIVIVPSPATETKNKCVEDTGEILYTQQKTVSSTKFTRNVERIVHEPAMQQNRYHALKCAKLDAPALMTNLSWLQMV